MARRPTPDISSLSTSQLKALEEMRDIFKDDPTVDDPSYWFNLKEDHTYLRYLRARNYDVKKASEMLANTVTFRKLNSPETINEHDPLLRNMLNEKLWKIIGLAKNGSPVQINYVNSSFNAANFQDEEVCHRYFILVGELAGRLMMKNEWKSLNSIILYDLENFSLSKNATPFAYNFFKRSLDVFSNHYPELVEKIIVYNSPMVFRGVWAIVRPWVEPGIQEKVIFVKDMQPVLELVDKDVLMKKHGGTKEGEYPSLFWETEQ